MKSIPINIGEKLGSSSIGGLNPTHDVGTIAEGAREVLESYEHRVTRHLVIDYKVDENRKMQFHIFPNVPSVNAFLPDNQKFVSAVEAAFIKVLGRGAVIEADLNEFDGIHRRIAELDGKPVEIEERKDTRVIAYLRDRSGALTHISHPTPVPKLWICVHSVPGLMAPPQATQERLVEMLVEETEKLVPGA